MKQPGLLILAVFMAAISCPGIANGADWKTKNLTNNAGDSFNPAIAVAGSNIYVVWDDDTITADHLEIYFMNSSDGGATWKAARRLTHTPGVSQRPAIAVDGSNVYVVWEDDTPGNFDIYLKKSIDGGVTWQSAKRISSLKTNANNPRIAAKGSILYAVWQEEMPGGEGEEIYLKKSSDGGVTWQTAKNLSNNPGTSWLPVITVNGSKVYVVWTEWALSNYEIYFTKSSDEGASWRAGKRLSYNSGSSWYPDIAIDGKRIYVVWADNTPVNNEIFFRKSNDEGKKWLAPKRLTNTPGHSWGPKIAVSGQNLLMIWYDYTPGREGIYLRKSSDEGSSWQALQRLTLTFGDSRTPSIGTNGSGIYVVWAFWNQANYEIYLTYTTEESSLSPSEKAGVVRIN